MTTGVPAQQRAVMMAAADRAVGGLYAKASLDQFHAESMYCGADWWP